MPYISDTQVDFSISSSIVIEHVHHLVERIYYSFAILFQIDIFVHESRYQRTLATLGLP